MKYDWNNWNIGGKIIFVSSCAATLSMIMNWVDVGIASQSGLSQGAFLFLLLWIYPVLMLFKNKPILKSWGLGFSIASVIFSLVYISSKSIELFGRSVNAAASGAYIFLFASIGLIFGIIKYECSTPSEQNIGKNS